MPRCTVALSLFINEDLRIYRPRVSDRTMVATYTGNRFACCASGIESSWSSSFPSLWIVPERSSLSRVRCAAPKRRALDSSGPFWRNPTYTSGEGGFGNLYDPGIETFRHITGETTHALLRLEAPAQRQGAGCRNFSRLPARGRAFSLDILFYRTKLALVGRDGLGSPPAPPARSTDSSGQCRAWSAGLLSRSKASPDSSPALRARQS
jgi:hypothetical protein